MKQSTAKKSFIKAMIHIIQTVRIESAIFEESLLNGD